MWIVDMESNESSDGSVEIFSECASKSIMGEF